MKKSVILTIETEVFMNTIKEFQRIMATQTELALATIGTDSTPNFKIVNYYLILRIMSYTLRHLKIMKKYMKWNKTETLPLQQSPKKTMSI